MKAVVKHAAERGIQVREDWAEPVAGPGQVLLEVAAASLCGTDRSSTSGRPPRRRSTSPRRSSSATRAPGPCSRWARASGT
jgi:threonine dehydrogenase-like Zn-dependent dehydrogenase